MKLKHLIYDCQGAPYGNEYKHPQKEMQDLGITYQLAVPQSMGDCWQFFNCKNIPSKLPDHIKELKIDPMEMIGYGLSKEHAESIIKNQNK